MTVTKASIGLGNVDNTADRDKPISRKLQSVLDRKADDNHTHDSQGGVSLATVKADTEIASAINLRHGNTNDHAPGSDNQDLSGKADAGHTHSYEPANANIQTHVGSAHAPSNAQANADITKAEIEAKLTGTLTSHSHNGLDTRTPYTLLSTGATAMGLALNQSVKVTPNATATYTTTVPPSGSRATIMILTSGTTSRTITFGSGFKPTTTLATGTVTARVFVIHWISDGVNLYEAGRTIAMVA